MVQGIQVAVTFARGSPARRAASAFAGPGSARAGACQAPQTTAIRANPSFRAARIPWRICASRSASSPSGGGAPARSAAIASPISAKRPVASCRCSIWCSHHSSWSV